MTNIPWRIEWKALSARIEGLVRGGEFYYQTLQTSVGTGDSFGAYKNILLQAEELYDRLEAYRQMYSKSLPDQVIDAFDRFLPKNCSYFKNLTNDNLGNLAVCLPYVQYRLVTLASFRCELDFYLSGLEDQIRTAAERAFLHLQRSIIADNDYRKRWESAFADGETTCERLGSVHLLWHGIWAFKVDAKGGRTDLVMGSQIDNPTQVSEVALGLVLTEWKCAKSDSEVEKKYKEACKQASLYSGGILGGIELASPRYLVIITLHEFTSDISDIDEGNVRYRFVNIAVDPNPPSRAARKNT